MTDIRKLMDVVESNSIALTEAQISATVVKALFASAAAIMGANKQDLIDLWDDAGRPSDNREIIELLKTYGLSKTEIYTAYKNTGIIGGSTDVGSSLDLGLGQKIGKKFRELTGHMKTSRAEMLKTANTDQKIEQLAQLIVNNGMTGDMVRYLTTVHKMKEAKDIQLTESEVHAILSMLPTKAADTKGTKDGNSAP